MNLILHLFCEGPKILVLGPLLDVSGPARLFCELFVQKLIEISLQSLRFCLKLVGVDSK